MSLEFLLALSILIAVSLIALAWNRGLIVAAMLLPASEMFGLLDPMTIAIKGAFDIHALLVGFFAAMVVAGGFGTRSGAAARFRLPMLALGALWVIGIVLPMHRQESSLMQAIEASKEFMMILAYPSLLLFLRDEREVTCAWRCLLAFGGLYCLIELVAQFGGVRLLSRSTYSYRPDAFGLWKVYLPFWPLILIFLFYQIFAFALGGKRRLVLVALGAAGLLLTFYRSYLLATLLVIPLTLMLSRMWNARAAAAIPMLAGLLATVLLGASMVVAAPGGKFQGLADVFVVSGIQELRQHSGGALEGRAEHSEELMRVLKRRPLAGYGFVNQDSPGAARLNLPTFAGSVLGFVDKGSADVLVKFGYVGGASLYLIFGWIGWRALSAARGARRRETAAKYLTAAALIGVFLCVQPVHAPFTYSFALLPLCLLLAIADREDALADYPSGSVR